MTWYLGFHVQICTYLPVNVEVGVPVKWLEMPEAGQVKGEGSLGFWTVCYCTGRVHISGNVCFSVKQILGSFVLCKSKIAVCRAES